MSFFKEIAKHFRMSPEDQRALEELKARHRQEEEDYAADSLYYLYVTGEMRISNSALKMQRNSSQYPDVDLLLRNRIRSESSSRLAGFHDELMEVTGERLLDTAAVNDPLRRSQIKIEALRRAKSFWEEELNLPDLTIDQIMLGRRRLTQITSKLEQIDPGYQPSQ